MGLKTRVWLGVLAACLVGPGAAQAQDLADFDYENLSFRGFGVEWGYLYPTRVDETQSFGVRFDLGYLGPGLRIVPSVSYWSSPFSAAEVTELEDRVASLVAGQVGGAAPTVDLGSIKWTDVAVALDAQVVWAIPLDILTFAGIGLGVHSLNGDGQAINGTFVEDLLDSVAAGFNLHAGFEYPVTDWFRLNTQGRYEVLGDLQYFQVRVGAQFMIGDNAPGEERGG
jgi:opacity protein-like surface antigen